MSFCFKRNEDALPSVPTYGAGLRFTNSTTDLADSASSSFVFPPSAAITDSGRPVSPATSETAAARACCPRSCLFSSSRARRRSSIVVRCAVALPSSSEALSYCLALSRFALAYFSHLEEFAFSFSYRAL